MADDLADYVFSLFDNNVCTKDIVHDAEHLRFMLLEPNDCISVEKQLLPILRRTKDVFVRRASDVRGIQIHANLQQPRELVHVEKQLPIVLQNSDTLTPWQKIVCYDVGYHLPVDRNSYKVSPNCIECVMTGEVSVRSLKQVFDGGSLTMELCTHDTYPLLLKIQPIVREYKRQRTT